MSGRQRPRQLVLIKVPRPRRPVDLERRRRLVEVLEIMGRASIRKVVRTS